MYLLNLTLLSLLLEIVPLRTCALAPYLYETSTKLYLATVLLEPLK